MLDSIYKHFTSEFQTFPNIILAKYEMFEMCNKRLIDVTRVVYENRL